VIADASAITASAYRSIDLTAVIIFDQDGARKRRRVSACTMKANPRKDELRTSVPAYLLATRSLSGVANGYKVLMK
jgi:hypothetical protein